MLSAAAEAVLGLPLRYTMLFQSAIQGALQAVQLMLLAHSAVSPSSVSYPKNQPQGAAAVKQKRHQHLHGLIYLFLFSSFSKDNIFRQL